MNIKAYRLTDQAVALQPLSPAREWGKNGAYTAANAPSGQGWNLFCPLAFAATWNGGPRPEDIEIRYAGADGETQPHFVQSNRGGGVLTFYPGYQFKTEDGCLLWLRGPVNAPKDGLSPLEQIVDTSLLPCTVSVHWQFTRPHQTICFEAGEPFATLLLYPKSRLEKVEVEVMQLGAGQDAYEHNFQQMLDNPALSDLFLRLGATPVRPAAAGAGDPQPIPGAWAARNTNLLPPEVALTPEYWIEEILGWPDGVTKYMQLHYLFLTAGDAERAEEALRQASEQLPPLRTEKLQDLTAGSKSVDKLTGAEIRSIRGLEKLGSTNGGWIVPTLDISEGAVCYLAGVGEDITFDLAIIARFNCTVFAFDPTPRAKLHVLQQAAHVSQFHFFNFGLWDAAGMLKFYAPSNPEHVSHSILNLQNSDRYFEAPCKRISAIMREMGHSRIQLLKLDIEGAEYRVIDSLIEDRLDIGIICVEYHAIHNDADDEFPSQIKKSIARLCEMGYALVAVDEPTPNYTFVKESFLSHQKAYSQ